MYSNVLLCTPMNVRGFSNALFSIQAAHELAGVWCEALRGSGVVQRGELPRQEQGHAAL